MCLWSKTAESVSYVHIYIGKFGTLKLRKGGTRTYQFWRKQIVPSIFHCFHLYLNYRILDCNGLLVGLPRTRKQKVANSFRQSCGFLPFHRFNLRQHNPIHWLNLRLQIASQILTKPRSWRS